MTNSNKLSVIIPVFDAAQYLPRCFDSLMNQSLDEGIEFIFIDDYSTDNSLSVLRELVCKYPHRLSQIKIIENKSNIGVGASRQIGIEASTSNYIIHCDPDDWVERNFYAKILQEAEESEMDIIISDFYKCNDSERNLIKQSPEKLDATYILSCITGVEKQSIHGGLWNKLIRADLFRKYPFISGLNYCEDVYFLWRVLQDRVRIGYLNYAGYNYYDNCKSITRTFDISKIHVENQLIGLLESDIKKVNDPFYVRCGLSLISSIIFNRIIRYKNLSTEMFKLDYSKYSNCESYNKQLNLIAKMILRIAFGLNFKTAQGLFFGLQKLKGLRR